MARHGCGSDLGRSDLDCDREVKVHVKVLSGTIDNFDLIQNALFR